VFEKSFASVQVLMVLLDIQATVDHGAKINNTKLLLRS